MKPQSAGQLTALADLDGMVALGRQPRAEQDGVTEDQRGYIRGEFVVTMLERQIQVAKAHRFADFDSLREALNAALE